MMKVLPPRHCAGTPHVPPVHINDMASQVQRDTRCRLFADDSLLYQVIDSTLDQVQLQQDLKNLEKWP